MVFLRRLAGTSGNSMPKPGRFTPEKHGCACVPVGTNVLAENVERLRYTPLSTAFLALKSSEPLA